MSCYVLFILHLYESLQGGYKREASQDIILESHSL